MGANPPSLHFVTLSRNSPGHQYLQAHSTGLVMVSEARLRQAGEASQLIPYSNAQKFARSRGPGRSPWLKLHTNSPQKSERPLGGAAARAWGMEGTVIRGATYSDYVTIFSSDPAPVDRSPGSFPTVLFSAPLVLLPRYFRTVNVQALLSASA